MKNAAFTIVEPENEQDLDYAPGSPERAALKARLGELSSKRIEIPLVIGGRRVKTGRLGESRMPHRHRHVLASFHQAGPKEVRAAIGAALKARAGWAALGWKERAAVFTRAAKLLSGPWRQTLNAATMLGQGKTVHQAEIDAACELADFWWFNSHYMGRINAQQPRSTAAAVNTADYRPLEGFVFAVTPFNFTAIAGNLPAAAAIIAPDISSSRR